MTASQVEMNHRAYLDRHRHLEDERSGEFALMHDGEVIAIYDDLEIAFRVGVDRFGDGGFSIEEIGAQPFRLGVFNLH